MKPQFQSYLLSLGMSPTLIGSIEGINEILAPIAGQEFQDIHVSEYLDSGGQRVFENIGFFTYTHIWGAAILPQLKYIDGIKLKDQILGWKITQENYNFISAEQSSQATLDIRYLGNGNIHTEFKASGPNCDHLFQIVKKYIVPNIFDESEKYAPANINSRE